MITMLGNPSISIILIITIFAKVIFNCNDYFLNVIITLPLHNACTYSVLYWYFSLASEYCKICNTLHINSIILCTVVYAP